jgi:predicted DCC family thiol-disulfide oxidoreductase YuxK
MDTKKAWPMTVLYDGACPVCSFEMDHLREREHGGRLVFVDIAAPGFDPAPYGLTLAALNAQIHAVLPDGTLLRGMEVLRRAYAAAGLGWVLQPSAWGPLRPLADAGYRVFARHRRTISRLAAPAIAVLRTARAARVARHMRACSAGTCEVDNGRPS